MVKLHRQSTNGLMFTTIQIPAEQFISFEHLKSVVKEEKLTVHNSRADAIYIQKNVLISLISNNHCGLFQYFQTTNEIFE